MGSSFEIDRRGFLKSSLLAAGAACGFREASVHRAAAAARVKSPDVIIRNALVITVDSKTPRATCVALSGDGIFDVGDWSALHRLADAKTQIIDAGGQTIVPGFVDAHNHAVGEVLAYEVVVGNPFDVEFVTIQSILDKLTARAAQTPPGQWVEGFFYDDTKLKDGRALSRTDLDKVSTRHPVMVTHRGGHTCVVNSVALQLAGVTRETPNPFGGTYGRDANGDLDGRVTDLAAESFAVVGRRPSFTAAQKTERARIGAARMSQEFARYGLTSVHHDGIGHAGSDAYDAILAIHAEGKLLHRVRYEPSMAHLEQLISKGIKTGDGDEWVRIGAVCEQLSDGSFSERTLSRRDPYPGSNPPYYGNLMSTQERLDALVVRLVQHRIQPNFHANGDVAIDMVLSAFERAAASHPDAMRRPKITHCTMVTPELVRRMKAVGVAPNLFATYPFYNSDKFGFYGPAMMDRAMAFRWLLDAGVPASAGSDFPPGPIAPMMGLQGLVTRKGWNGEVWGAGQAITPAEALKVWTLNGAYAAFEEDVKGSIAPGKFADLVFLDRDPLTADPQTLKGIKVTRTIVGGRTVYQA
jgi:predicted amidohydrolase YtcJ